MKPLWKDGRTLVEGSFSPSAEVGLFAGEFAPPLLIAKDSALNNNASLMAAYCDRHGLSLAPHAKTSMAPGLLRRQLDAGVWGLTVATAAQACLLRTMGISTILIANELVDSAAITWIMEELDADPALRILCLVDSVDGVTLLADACAGSSRRLEVLIELGIPGGRTGCRSIHEAIELADALLARSELSLAGVECYEGVIADPSPVTAVQRVDTLLDDLRSLATQLDGRDAFSDAQEIIVSAGGSAYFDRVAARLTRNWDLSRPVRVVVRSGAYIAHDSGFYADISPLDGRSVGLEGRLIAALEIWGAVLSRPEPDLAIIGFGKRDVSYDLSLPTPQKVRKRDGAVVYLQDGTLSVVALNDEHAYLRGDCSSLSIGDWVACGLSHPCTAFDKWSVLLLVNDDYQVVDLLRTEF